MNCILYNTATVKLHKALQEMQLIFYGTANLTLGLDIIIGSLI